MIFDRQERRIINFDDAGAPVPEHNRSGNVQTLRNNITTNERESEMQALRIHDYGEGIRLDTMPLLNPGPGEIRVRVQACGVSFVDLLVAGGGYQLRPALPFVAGSEFAGVVDALGDGAGSRFAVGDRVSGSGAIGAWTQYACVTPMGLTGVAAGVPIEEAAVLNVPFATALYGLRDRGRLQRGETLLVLGATGSVGHAAVQLGKLLGARVIAAVSGELKRTAALESGVDEVVDARDPEWKNQVKSLAAGGVDVVFDTVGGDMTDAAFRTLGWGGRHLMVGFAGGQIGALRSNLTIMKGASLVGVDIRQFGEREPVRASALMEEVAALHAQASIRPRIAAALPLAQFAEATARVRDRNTIGRILLCP